MEAAVRKLSEHYAHLFREALAGKTDIAEVVALYASDVISASTAGVMSGKNDDKFKQILASSYEHYRAIGTKSMRLRHIRLSPIDENHCVAHVAWTATYARKDQPDTTIDFDVHYLVQVLQGEAKVFGWVSGDEQALLKQHGIG
ncbi:nuclear transport factor 2 family protein [Rhizobium sp. ZK1]|uniref:nuclear transport factor 2 family protein n=1 Tax=Rhizobium sp. ZK1 TaxID=3389872 RepID=UPI0039F6F595